MKWVHSKNANNDNNAKLFKQLIIQVGKAKGHRRHENEKFWRACTDWNLRGAGKHKLLTIKVEVEIFTCYNPYWSPRKIQYFPPNFLVREPVVNRQFGWFLAISSQKLFIYIKFPQKEIKSKSLYFTWWVRTKFSSAITW